MAVSAFFHLCQISNSAFGRVEMIHMGASDNKWYLFCIVSATLRSHYINTPRRASTAGRASLVHFSRTTCCDQHATHPDSSTMTIKSCLLRQAHYHYPREP